MNTRLCVVQIETVEGVFLGSGFFISKTRILSCSHVLGTKHASEIVVRWLGEKRRVDQCKKHSNRDVVCLVIARPFSLEPEIIEWAFDTPTEGRVVHIFGFNKPEVYELEHLTRHVRGYAAQYDLDVLDSPVLRGFSGSPACIDNAFVGMVVAADEARTLLIPATALRAFAPEQPPELERPTENTMDEVQAKFKIEKEVAKRDIYQAVRDIIIQPPNEPKLKESTKKAKEEPIDIKRKEILKKALKENGPWRSIEVLTRLIGFDNKKEECKEECRQLLTEIGARRSIKEREMWGLISDVGLGLRPRQR